MQQALGSLANQAIPKSAARLAFVHFVRTGRVLPESAFVTPAPIEAKFNPYHDPKDGRFTFGPGGGAPSRPSGGSWRAASSSVATAKPIVEATPPGTAAYSDGVYRPLDNGASLLQRTAGSGPPRGIGSNSGAFLDPMTLEQSFPGLSSGSAGAVIAVADPIFDLTGPAREATDAWSLAYSNALIDQIKQIDPKYRFDSLGFPSTFEGQIRQIDELRWDRAVVIYRATGNAGPLQVETLRFLQDRTDAEYENALVAAKAGTLPPAPTERMAIGNFIDRAVKRDLREQLSVRAISTGRDQSVRIDGREYDTSANDLTYSIPDVRIDDVAFDVTLWQKSPRSRQIYRFFNSDFKPRTVLIIRPRQISKNSTYAIKRPGK